MLLLVVISSIRISLLLLLMLRFRVSPSRPARALETSRPPSSRRLREPELPARGFLEVSGVWAALGSRGLGVLGLGLLRLLGLWSFGLRVGFGGLEGFGFAVWGIEVWGFGILGFP